ncbi:hypothetical protein [Streptomyces sp. NPDC007088]|uniref:hypothetical protein n=1 Tax=Streptomyces sp. NPDC007088 TaxID=3364773 RepID=UPI0036A841B5
MSRQWTRARAGATAAGAETSTAASAWWDGKRARVRARVRKRVGAHRVAGGPGDVAGDGGPEGPDAAGDDLRTLAQDLPDEDIADDLDDQLDCYRLGSKPRCEEVEYLRLVEDARDRMG